MNLNYQGAPGQPGAAGEKGNAGAKVHKER